MPAPITIVVDTREQQPYSFDPALATTIRATLPAGDYSILGHETRVAIERKSLADFVSTVIHARERFSRELAMLARYEYAAVVVEGSLEDILEHRYGQLASPASVWGAAVSIAIDRRVPVVWAGGRPFAAKWTCDALRRWARGVGAPPAMPPAPGTERQAA